MSSAAERWGATGPGADPAEGRSFLPLAYYVDFLRVLRERPDRYVFITYEDLAWQEGDDPEDNYPGEWTRWRERTAGSGKIHVLIHHDVDAFPALGHAMLEAERRLGVTSSTMLFHRRLHRRRYERDGAFEYTEYDVDFGRLRRLQGEGFVFGYHCNAYERARFDAERAVEVFEEDVAALRERLTVRYCSGHGGLRDARGLSNRILDVPASLASGLRWVHNGASPRFDGAYSDGGFDMDLRHPDELDLRRHVERWRPGGRYRVLIHPQYYEDPPRRRAGAMVGAHWYERVWNRYRPYETRAGGDCGSLWTEGAVAGRRHGGQASRLHVAFERRIGGWGVVARRVRALCHRRWRVPPVDVDASPIFVRAVSRSGGTLTVTILDAHPDVAMSYELYPNMIADPRRRWGEHFEYAERPGPPCGPAEMGTGERIAFLWKHLPGINLVHVPRKVYRRTFERNDEHTFLNNCMRSGLTRKAGLRFLREHVGAGFGLGDAHGALRVIERVCSSKAARTGASRWGLKCSNQFEVYHDLWPDAVFVNVVRDVRDVAASQMTVGAFDRNPRNIASKWAGTHARFAEFVRNRRPRSFLLYYEKLVSDPERTLNQLCEATGLTYTRELTDFHRKDLSIYRAGHISLNRISRPIDASQVGRWKRDVDPDAVAQIEEVAGDVMREHGYRTRASRPKGGAT